MQITIGNRTRKNMEVLLIESYPFVEDELKSKYRELMLIHHPDKGGSELKAKQIIQAYKELLPLSKQVSKDEFEISERKKRIQEEIDKDMFAIYEDCKICHGEGKIKRYENNIIKCKICQNGFIRNKRETYFDFLDRIYFGKAEKCYQCKGYGYLKGIGQKEIIENCHNCNGTGKIKIDIFNPVIPKGAVL